MRVLKLIQGLGGGLIVTLTALSLAPLRAAASGPGTATSNLTTVSTGYVADSTGSAEAMSNAEFTVTPGPLSLNQVPNISLGSTSVKSIVSGDTVLPVVSGSTGSGTGFDGNSTGELNVTDYRGDHAGWSLNVGLGPFTMGTATIANASLALNEAPATLDNTATTAPNNLTLTQSTTTNGWVSNPETLWSATTNTGEGSNSASTANSSSLTITKQPTITAGTYTATLYWALQDAPSTATPAH